MDKYRNLKNVYRYDTAIGRIHIADNGRAIAGVFLPGETVPSGVPVNETDVIKRAAVQITEYLSGRRREFDVPVEPEGTDFQKRVWAALCTIPYGRTCSYAHIAHIAGNPKACRAVGMANNRNPVSIIIPCHRVIGKSGALVGYGGGLELKKYLLDMEAANTIQG